MIRMGCRRNYITCRIKEPLEHSPLYHHELIYEGPFNITPEGKQIWEVGSWSKKDLNKFISLVKRKFNGNMKAMLRDDSIDFSIFGGGPELTGKQKLAMDLALKNGYYDGPKSRAYLKDLAKKMGICYSTYQVHLKKAERKILLHLYSKDLN